MSRTRTPSDPTTDKVGFWGPPVDPAVDPSPRRRPAKPKKAWGLSEILRAGLIFLVTQIALIPVLTFMAMATYNIDLAAADAGEQLTDALVDVTTTAPGLTVALLFQWAAFVGAPWLTSRLRGHRSLARDFGLSFRKSDLWWGAALAWTLQVAMLGFSWIVQQTSLDLEGANNTNMVTDQAGLALVIMILAASIGAPITEEIFFRGLLLRSFLRGLAKVDHAPVLLGVTDHFHPSPASRTRQTMGTVAAIFLSSAAFGIMHPNHWLLIVQTGLLGAVFAVVAVKTRRIGLPIVAHMVFNSTSLALTFMFN